MKRRALLMALTLSAGVASAVGIKLRPQGEVLTRAVQTALGQLSTKDVPFTLDTSSGTTLTLGGVGASAAPFNPDVAARVVQIGGETRVEFNPQGPLPLTEAVRSELQRLLKLDEWSPGAAQARFGGADLNADGRIDLLDLAILMESMGKSGYGKGDLNQDSKVDEADLKLFSAQYDLSRATAPLPEETKAATDAPATAAPASPAAAPATPKPADSSTGTPSTPPTPPATTPPAAPVTPNPTTPPNPAPVNPAPTNPPAKP